MEHILCLQIEDDIHYATVTPDDNPYHHAYHVLFEDGYENIFFTDVETGRWMEEDLGETALAANFGIKINSFEDDLSIPRKTLSWCRASVASMIINFGFHTYKENGRTVFEIYADNHKFLCNLSRTKKGKWMVYGSPRAAMEHQYTNQVQVIISIFEEMADQK